MLFIEFARYLQRLEETPKRLEMTSILADLIKQLSIPETDISLYLSLGYLKAPFESEKFEMADRMAIRVLMETFNVGENTVEDIYKRTGDLGTIAHELSNINTSDLSISQVYEKLLSIAETEGTGSQDAKIHKTAALLKSLDKISCKYVIRIVLGTTRLGFTELTMMDALSLYLGNKDLKKDIEQKYNTHPDIGRIAKAIKENGIEGLKNIGITPGIPILLQKTQRVKNFEEVLSRMETAWLEYKLDGTRVQLHIDKNKIISEQTNSLFGASEDKYLIKTFTRNLEETTNMYPDLIEGAKKQVKATSVILDGEAVGYNPETGIFLPFQEIMQRKRKYGIAEMAKEIPLKYCVFDILYLNGKTLVDKTLEERKQLLEKVIDKGDVIENNKHVVAHDTDAIYEYFEDAKEKGLEGLIAKNPKDKYQSGARSYSWIKLKVADEKLMEDSVDCVILGYYNGKGTRAKFGIGGVLLGVYDPDTDGFKTVSKLGTGLTEQELEDIKKMCDKEKTSEPTSGVVMSKMFTPDVYVYPKIIMEVGADEVTKSPSHSAGYALRFPRMLKIRTDKSALQATTTKEIEAMYKNKR